MIQIAVSDSVARIIAERVAQRHLNGPGAYIEELVEADMISPNRRRIDQALLEALTDDSASDLEWNEAAKAKWRQATQARLNSETKS